jgi:hypothetical protein
VIVQTTPTDLPSGFVVNEVATNFK